MTLANRILSLTPISAALGLIVGCGQADISSMAPSTLPTIKVTVAAVQNSPFTSHRELPGTVQAVARATVSAKTLGTVESTGLSIGQRVATGDLLVTLTADELNARVAQARAVLDLVRKDYEREVKLLEQGATAAEVVRSLEDQNRIAAANLAQIEAQLSYTRINAPFDGVITARLVEPGDLASAGTGLFTIEGTDAFEVELGVPDSLLTPTIGAAIQMVIAGNPVTGSLREISPAANPISRTRVARVQLPAGAVSRSGHYVKVQWPDQTGDQITVPATAVTHFGQMQRVFVVVEGQAVLRLVRTGATWQGRTIILAGLNSGEVVVVDSASPLRDGQPIQVAP